MPDYLTGTGDRERKRGRKKGRTPAPTHLAQNGQILKGKGKGKADGRRAKHRQRRGGRTEAPDTTFKGRATPTTLWTAEVFNPSNWCTVEPHQRPEKKKHHACKHVLIPVLHHDGTVKCISVHEHCTLLGKAEKRGFTASCTTTRLRRKL